MAYEKKNIKEVKEKILKLIATGNSLKSILEKNDDMPSRETVYTWLREHSNGFDKNFLDNYVRAREEQADFYADEIIDIADNSKDWQKARLQIDARKWKASKMLPKKYGDKIDFTSKGERISGPESIKVIFRDFSDDSEDE